MTRKTAPKKTRAKRPVIAAKPVVVIVDKHEVKAIPIPRSAMGQVYDFFAGLVSPK